MPAMPARWSRLTPTRRSRRPSNPMRAKAKPPNARGAVRVHGRRMKPKLRRRSSSRLPSPKPPPSPSVRARRPSPPPRRPPPQLLRLRWPRKRRRKRRPSPSAAARRRKLLRPLPLPTMPTKRLRRSLTMVRHRPTRPLGWTRMASRAAESEALFKDMSRQMIVAAGLSPANVQVELIQDDEINAFVAGGQTIYIQSGLIQAADIANQVQGVIAHELGHIADGHVVLADAGYRPAIGNSMLSMVLGIAAVAAGAGEAGAGIITADPQAALGTALSYTRVQAATADATGAKFLRAAGLSGKGMIQFFKKLANDEYRYGLANIDPYAQTHPLSNERVNT